MATEVTESTEARPAGREAADRMGREPVEVSR